MTSRRARSRGTKPVVVRLEVVVAEDGLVLQELNPESSSSRFVLWSLGGDLPVEPLLETDFSVSNGALSPDGRWIAYESNATGMDEIYVRPLPVVDAGRWQISSGGGEYATLGTRRQRALLLDLR